MSSISSVSSTAARGLAEATSRLEHNAQRVALVGLERAPSAEKITISPEARAAIDQQDDLVRATTDRMTASISFKANIKTMQTAQEMDETLLSLGGRP